MSMFQAKRRHRQYLALVPAQEQRVDGGAGLKQHLRMAALTFASGGGQRTCKTSARGVQHLCNRTGRLSGLSAEGGVQRIGGQAVHAGLLAV